MASDKSKQDLLSARHRAAVSIGLNLALAVGKGVAGVAASSTALIGDAIHSATDVVSSITVLAGIKISKRKSKNFPYGLYKVENFELGVEAA